MWIYLARETNLLTFASVGLVVWGISIDKRYHWMVGQVAFFLCKPISLPSSLSFTPYLHMDGCLYSRRRNPNRKYSHKQLHSRQLPSPIHQRGHILRCIPSPTLHPSILYKQTTNRYGIVLHFLMAGFVRLDLDIYRGSTYCARWRDVSLCFGAEIRGVDEDFRTGAFVG